MYIDKSMTILKNFLLRPYDGVCGSPPPPRSDRTSPPPSPVRPNLTPRICRGIELICKLANGLLPIKP